MKTGWNVGLLWVGLAVAAAGAATTIQGALMLSAPIAITGIAITLSAPAAWVLWAIAGMLISLRTRL